MDNKNFLLEDIDADIIGEMTGNRENIAKAGKMAGISGSTLISTAALAATTFGAQDKLPGNIVDVLNFALTLEYLEDEFYRTGLSRGFIPIRQIFLKCNSPESLLRMQKSRKFKICVWKILILREGKEKTATGKCPPTADKIDRKI